MIKGLVIAGKFHEYKRWLIENGFDPKDYRYVAGKEDVYGYHKVELFYVGTYYHRCDIDLNEIRMLVQ